MRAKRALQDKKGASEASTSPCGELNERSELIRAKRVQERRERSDLHPLRSSSFDLSGIVHKTWAGSNRPS
jgi:hypothetical protein